MVRLRDAHSWVLDIDILMNVLVWIQMVIQGLVLFDCAPRVHSRRAIDYDGLAFDGSWSWKTRA